MKTKTESELTRLVELGDQFAFAELMRRNKQLVFSIFHSFYFSYPEQQDLFQDLSIKIWFYFQRGKFKHEGKFSAFIAKGSKNLCLSFLRSKKRHQEISLETIHFQTVDKMSPYVVLVDQEYKEKLKKFVKTLPYKDRYIHDLRINDGLKIKEIAKNLNISKNTVSGSLLRTRRKFLEKQHLFEL